MSRIILPRKELILPKKKGRCNLVSNMVIRGGGQPVNNNIKFLSHLDATPWVDEKGGTALTLKSGSLSTFAPKFGAGSLSGILAASGTLSTGINWSGAWTIRFWIKTSDAVNLSTIFHAYNTANLKSVLVYTNTAGNLVVSNGSSGITSSGTVNNGAWIYVLITNNGVNSCSLYLNGSNQGSSNPFTLVGGSTYATIGGRSFNGVAYSNAWSGVIDEFRVDTAVASSPTTVPTSPFTLSSPS